MKTNNHKTRELASALNIYWHLGCPAEDKEMTNLEASRPAGLEIGELRRMAALPAETLAELSGDEIKELLQIVIELLLEGMKR